MFPSKKALMGIMKTDGLRMVRDRFVVGMFVYIVGIAIAMRFILGWVTDELMTRTQFDLVPWYPLLVSYIVVGLAGLLAGIVGGFLLLEGREDRTIKAQLVSPVPITSYLLVVCSFVFLGSVGLGVFDGLVIGRGAPSLLPLLACSIAAAPTALIYALFLGSWPDNKTEAFAYMKICSSAPLIPAGAYFLPEPWQWLVGIYPQFWAFKAYWVAEAGGTGWWWMCLVGLFVSVFWVWFFVKLFIKAAHER